MLKNSSFFQIILVALIVSGTVPFIVVAVQAADTIQAVTGLIALVLSVFGVSVWVTRLISAPVSQLASAAEEIQMSVNDENANAIMPALQHVSSLEGVKEIQELSGAFRQMVTVLQQRMVELNSVYAMGQAISAKVDFEQTVQAVLEAVQQVVVFDAAEVAVLRGQKLVVEAWHGQEDFNDTTGREYRVGRGPTGMIASHRASVLVSTIAGDEEDLKRTLGYESAAGEFLAKTHKVVINSFLGIPLVTGDRLIGTLTLVHREPGRFTEDDKRQLNKLAAQASIAIDNAIQVRQRENILKAQIRELRVEIDQTKLDQQVEEITTTDYFQHLQSHAAKMRNRVYTRGKSRSSLEESNPDTSSQEPSQTEEQNL